MRSEEGETPPLTKEEPGRVFRLTGRSGGKAGERRSPWSFQQDQDSPWAEPLADQRKKNTTAPQWLPKEHHPGEDRPDPHRQAFSSGLPALKQKTPPPSFLFSKPDKAKAFPAAKSARVQHICLKFAHNAFHIRAFQYFCYSLSQLFNLSSFPY